MSEKIINIKQLKIGDIIRIEFAIDEIVPIINYAIILDICKNEYRKIIIKLLYFNDCSDFYKDNLDKRIIEHRFCYLAKYRDIYLVKDFSDI